MSWLDKIENNKFSIKTGDGKTYFPLWKSGAKSKEYNNSIFDFIDVSGSKVDRKKPKSGKYTLIFWFQGEDNIDISQQFENSADDSRAWEVNHPFYGVLYGQPLSLDRNDSNYNATEITVEFWESINNKYPKKGTSPQNQAKEKSESFKNESATNYAAKCNPSPTDQSIVKANLENISTRTRSLLDNSVYSDYESLKSKALQSVDDLITSPVKAMKDVNTLILAPSEFEKSIEQRFSLLKNIYQDAKDVLRIPSRENKSYFESSAGTVICGLCVACLNPADGDYISRNDVELIFNDLVLIYSDYLLLLDQNQVDISNVNNSFAPSHSSQLVLNSLVNETLSNLFDLAFNSKQERSVILEKNTNLILLTHKYIGLDKEDKNIEIFRQMNGIKNKSLFIVKKGRKIKYFV